MAKCLHTRHKIIRHSEVETLCADHLQREIAVALALDFLRAGELEFAVVAEIQRQRHDYLALEMTGAQRFDFGVPDDFVASVQAFRHSS